MCPVRPVTYVSGRSQGLRAGHSIIGVDGRDNTPPLHCDHIDSAKWLWTIPRVKNDDTEFVISLSDAAMDILHDMRRQDRR